MYEKVSKIRVFRDITLIFFAMTMVIRPYNDDNRKWIQFIISCAFVWPHLLIFVCSYVGVCMGMCSLKPHREGDSTNIKL